MNNMKKIISFPHMGSYYIPIKYLMQKMTDYEVRLAPPITKKTLELGSKYAPDFVCIPFKYNLGNYIEAAEKGANVFAQTGGGCRFGYYYEPQSDILKRLGFKFDFHYLSEEGGKLTIGSVYRALKEMNGGKLSKLKFLYHGLITINLIRYIDKLEQITRENVGFEVKKKSFEKVHKEMIKSFSETSGLFNLKRRYKKVKKQLKKLEVNKPEDCLKVGIIGELFLVMEPFSNFNIEKELAKMGVEVHRETTLTYLLFSKPRNRKKLLRQTEGYLKKVLSGDAIDNVAHAKEMCEHGIDGIIHIKPFACIPEVGAIPIIDKIVHDHDVPAIYLSFDSQTSEEGIRTRLEAFYDMINMRKENKK